MLPKILRRGPFRGQEVHNLQRPRPATQAESFGPEFDPRYVLNQLGVMDPSPEELALATMWTGTFIRMYPNLGVTPVQLSEGWWGVQAEGGIFALCLVDTGFWPTLSIDYAELYRPRLTRVGVYAELVQRTLDAGAYWVGVSRPRDKFKPLIYRPSNHGWRAIGHRYNSDRTTGFFSRLLSRALGARLIFPDSVASSAPGVNGHETYTWGCKDCEQRNPLSIDAAGCAYPEGWI